MTYKDRLKQHILFFLYANLVSYLLTVTRESGHAIAATLTNRTNVSIKIDTTLSNFLAHTCTGRTTSVMHLEEITDKDYSTVRAWHLKCILVLITGPIFGLMGTYVMSKIYQKLKTSAQKISPFDNFWEVPFLAVRGTEALKLVPHLAGKNSDSSKIWLHLKGLKELYSLEKNGIPLDQHVLQYF